MSVPQPQILIDFSDASGPTLANRGSLGAAGNYLIDVGGGPDTVEWNGSTGDFRHFTTGGQFGRGMLDILTNSGNGMVWASTSATGPGTTLETMNLWLAFNLDSLHSGAAWLIGCGGAVYSGGLSVHGESPTGGGGSQFDLHIEARNTSGGPTEKLISIFNVTNFGAPLLFNTDYVCGVGFDGASAATCSMATRLALAGGASGVLWWGNATTGQSTIATADFSGTAALYNAWPQIGRRQDFSNHFGADSQLSGYGYQRAGAVWTPTNLTNILNDPGEMGGWNAATPTFPVIIPSRRMINLLNL